MLVYNERCYLIWFPVMKINDKVQEYNFKSGPDSERNGDVEVGGGSMYVFIDKDTIRLEV